MGEEHSDIWQVGGGPSVHSLARNCLLPILSPALAPSMALATGLAGHQALQLFCFSEVPWTCGRTWSSWTGSKSPEAERHQPQGGCW